MSEMSKGGTWKYVYTPRHESFFFFFFFQHPEPIIPGPLTGLSRDQAREWRLVFDIMSVISRSGLRPAELTGIPRPSYVVDVHYIPRFLL